MLAQGESSAADKKLFITTYKAYAKYKRLEWEPPTVQVADKLPFIPHEEEIDQLIAGYGRKTGTFLQVLKET